METDPNDSLPAYPAQVKYELRDLDSNRQHRGRKHRKNMRLIDRAFRLIPKEHRVLDVPCGPGRLTLHLARRGWRVCGADLSQAVLEEARYNAKKRELVARFDKQDAEGLTYTNRAFDTVVCFQLFHRISTPETREKLITELCRVAEHNVVLSYLTPFSLQAMRRDLTGAEGDTYVTPLKEVKSYFSKCNFVFQKDFTGLPFVSTLHLAVFARGG